MADPRAQETRLRNVLKRRDLRLMKSRARDEGSLTYGGYQIVDLYTNVMVAGSGATGRGYDMSLEEVEEWVREYDARNAA